MLKGSDRVGHDLALLQQLQQQQRQDAAGHSNEPEEPGGFSCPPSAAAAAALPLLPGHVALPDAPLPQPGGGSSSTSATASGATQPAMEAAAVSGSSATVVLRRWRDIPHEREFRCFVGDKQLVGVSQRDVTQHFPQVGRINAGRVMGVSQRMSRSTFLRWVGLVQEGLACEQR